MSPYIDLGLQAVTTSAIALITYHHVGYPLLLRALSPKADVTPAVRPRGWRLRGEDAHLPSVTILIPAFNEADGIAQKIMNVLSLDYPETRLRLRVICDGCTDDTYVNACRATDFDPWALDRVTIVNCAENRGKTAVLNEQLRLCDTDLVALTDVSSIVAVDALLVAARHFTDPKTACVSGTYRLLEPGTDGEAAYWRYQSRLRSAEARLGGAIGAHGAFYVVRRSSFEPIPADTINDDFVLPMTMVAAGYRAVHDESMLSYELDGTSLASDLRRRLRIGAGNLQQAVRCLRLLSPSRPGTAAAFFSGKFLRAFMPTLLVVALLGSLSLTANSPVWAILFSLQILGYALALAVHLRPNRRWPKVGRMVHYLVQGHIANGLGGLAYLTGKYRRPWRRITG